MINQWFSVLIGIESILLVQMSKVNIIQELRKQKGEIINASKKHITEL